MATADAQSPSTTSRWFDACCLFFCCIDDDFDISSGSGLNQSESILTAAEGEFGPSASARVEPAPGQSSLSGESLLRGSKHPRLNRGDIMARPLWSGNLQISLVSFGVGLVPATSPTSEISFHLDCLRNDRGSTAVSPYSPRARVGVPVALPISWKELDGPKAPSFTVENFKRWRTRLADDPWKEMSKLDQVLSQIRIK